MTYKLKHIIVSVLAVFYVIPAIANQISITASLDSAYILMGKQTTLHLEIIQGQDVVGTLINNNTDTITKEIEIIKYSNADTIDIGNNRNQILREIIIQSFDSGLYTLPPFQYAVGNDTIYSNVLALKVIPVSVDSLQTIHDYHGVEDPNTRIYDYLPDFITDYWWIFVILGIIIIGLYVYLKYLKKGQLPLLPHKKEIPPYELAMQQLLQLREERLCERGQEKEYYTRLTDILRVYLDNRFNINAMEMTSSQIISTLNKLDETKLPNKYMQQILEIADFVKFAKVRPLPDDNVKSHQFAMQFIEDTKPLPEIESDTEPQNAQRQENTNSLNVEND